MSIEKELLTPWFLNEQTDSEKGKPASQKKLKPKRFICMNLRLPYVLNEQVERIRRNQTPSPSKHYWILNAIEEAIKRADKKQ